MEKIKTFENKIEKPRSVEELKKRLDDVFEERKNAENHFRFEILDKYSNGEIDSSAYKEERKKAKETSQRLTAEIDKIYTEIDSIEDKA